MIIETGRLLLRPFEKYDRAPFAAINADPDVMRYFPHQMTRDQSDAMIDRIEATRSETGLCFLAAELRENGELAGMIGLAAIGDPLRSVLGDGCDYEIGWRLRRDLWGKGLAPEGALACLEYAWHDLKLSDVVAFTFAGNEPSRRVMEKIGMTYDAAGDFRHTSLPADHRLSAHVLYRIASPRP